MKKRPGRGQGPAAEVHVSHGGLARCLREGTMVERWMDAVTKGNPWMLKAPFYRRVSYLDIWESWWFSALACLVSHRYIPVQPDV